MKLSDLLYADLSPGAKVTWLKIMEGLPRGGTFTDVQGLVGNKASTWRHVDELHSKGWLFKSDKVYTICRPD